MAHPLDGFDLVTIGEGCVINYKAKISAVTMEKGWLRLRKVTLGDHVNLATW